MKEREGIPGGIFTVFLIAAIISALVGYVSPLRILQVLTILGTAAYFFIVVSWCWYYPKAVASIIFVCTTVLASLLLPMWAVHHCLR